MNAPLERIGHDQVTGRELLLLHTSSPVSMEAFQAPSQHSVGLLVWDSDKENVETVSVVVEQMLASGCIYLCAWGRGCERVEDIADAIVVGDYPDLSRGSFVMTTSHAHESLEEAILFFLRNTPPEHSCKESCRSGIVIIVGCDDQRAALVRRALSHPTEFTRKTLDQWRPE